jgi:hypothetical protein
MAVKSRAIRSSSSTMRTADPASEFAEPRGALVIDGSIPLDAGQRESGDSLPFTGQYAHPQRACKPLARLLRVLT